MGKLMDAYSDLAKKDKGFGSEARPNDFYLSGLDVLDYTNAKYRNDGTLAVGFEARKAIMLVGNPGVGKSTLGYQIGASIIKNFDEGTFFHDDFERAGSDERMIAITSLTEEDIVNGKYKRYDRDISTDSVYKQIFAINKLKVAAGDDIQYDTGLVDRNGNKVIDYQPTVVCIDSIALMTKQELDDKEEIGGQMDATAAAKANTSLYKRTANPCNNSNIIIIGINHLNDKVDINAFAKKQSSINFLKQDETIPGGKAPQYLSSYLIKLIASSKLVEEKEYGIKGYEVIIEFIKSRSIAAGTTCKLVFDQLNGFDNDLSNLLYLRDNKLLKGNGMAYYIDSYPDTKFKLKNFKEIKARDKKFSKAFDKYIKELLMADVKKAKVLENIEVPKDELEYLEDYECYYNRKLDKYFDEEGNELEFEEE